MTHSSSNTSSYCPPQGLLSTAQTSLSNNYFNRTHQVSLHSFSNSNYAQRKSVRKAVADETLAKAKPLRTQANWRQFALMHCPGIILETSLEGGAEQISAQSSLNFVNSCLSGDETVFSCNSMTNDTYRKLQTALSEYIKLYHLRPPLTDGLTPQNTLEKTAEEWLEQIKNSPSFAQSGVYLPLGYRHGTSNQGHAIGCKVLDDDVNDIVLVHLFNLGNGSESHPVLNYTLEQKKSSFSFDPIGIPKKLFFGEVGKALFCHLFRYLADAPSKDDSHYDGKDIYDIFFQFLQFADAGKIYPLVRQGEYAADLQKSGNCPEIAIRCIMEDVLIQAGISREEREKVFLNREFRSLMAHYHAFVHDPSCHPSARELLLDAARSCGATVKQLHKKKQITEQEFICATATIHEIVRATRKTPRLLSLPIYLSHTPRYHTLFERVAPVTGHSSSKAFDSSLDFEEIKLDLPRFSAKTLCFDVKRWIAMAKKLPTEFVFEYVSDCIRALPIPTSRDAKTKTEPWNEVPKADVLAILDGLKELLTLGLSQQEGIGGRDQYAFQDQFMMIYSVYSIADKLARGSEANKLEGYSCPFLPYLYQFEPYGFTSLPLKQDNERYTQIFEYMTGKKYLTDKGYNDKTIFPIEPILKVGEFVHDMLSGHTTKETYQGKNHVEYLAKLLPTSTNASETYLASYFAENWMSILPQEVRHLYYFSFLSNLLFSAKGMPLPTLSFSKTLESGKAALKIEAPFFDPKYSNRLLFARDLKPKLDKPIEVSEFIWHENSFHQGLHELNSHKKRKLTTNEAISYLLSEKERDNCKLDEPAMRTLLYDTRKDNLSLWQVLQDFSEIENHHLLGHPGIQSALSSCFFRPRFLLERMKAEPEELTKAFRALTTCGIERYNANPKQLSGILFLIRMGVCFESYTTRGSERDQILEFYRKILLKLSKAPLKPEEIGNVEYHLRFLDTQRDPINPEDLFVEIFEFQYKDIADHERSWLQSYIPKLRRWLAYKYADYFEDETKRNALCNRVISTVLNDPDITENLSHSKWEGSFPEFTCGDIVIDFLHMRIKNTKYKAKLAVFRIVSRDAEIGVPLSKYGRLFWSNRNMMISINGKVKCNQHTGEWTERISDTNGQEQEASIVKFRGKNHDVDQDFLGGHHSCFTLIHYKQTDGSIISHDLATKKPYLLRETLGNSVVYFRLTDDGKKLPFTLANLSKVDPHHPLYPYTVRYLPPSDIMCFVDETSKKIQEINFYKLKIQFIHDGKGLSWAQDPGFYLVGSETDLTTTEEKKAYANLSQEINSYEGAMILYNPKTKKWSVLFPVSYFSKVSQYGDDFSRNIRPSDKTQSPLKYLHFTFDPLEKNLKTLNSDRDCANAYLAILFKMQRSYEKAFLYLNKVKASSFFDEELASTLEKFFDIKDFSQASLAFNLRLCLFIIRNKNLMLEQQFQGRKHGYLYENCIKWALDNYKHYLCDDAASKTPETLHLSDGDKMKLILAFRRLYQDTFHPDEKYLSWEEKWKKEQPVLDAQYNIYFSAQKENILLPEPQEIFLSPPIFSSLQKTFFNWGIFSTEIYEIIASYESYHSTYVKRDTDLEIPPYPIRTTEETIRVHLPELYEEARKCTPGVLCPFDFKIHAFLKTKTPGKSKLATLLFWVRHFPELFADCPLNPHPTEGELSKIFARLRQISSLSPKKYGELLKRLNLKTTFKINHSIPLTAQKENVKNRKIKVAKTTTPPLDLSTYLNDTEKQIYRLFNSPYKVKEGALSLDEVEQELCFGLSKDSAQTLSFPKNGKFDGKTEGEYLPEVIMKQVILKNNLSYLYKHRPMLSRDEKNELCKLTNEWYHTKVLLRLKEEGKETLYLPYDYQKYPEISYFYLKTGKFPRKTQLEVYLWTMQRLEKGMKVHYQLGAGEGKTDVVGPLLNLGAKRLGLLPVTCVTQSIYPIDKENLSYNLGLLGEDLYYLEVGIHMINQLSAFDLEFIYTQLMQYKSEGKALILTRHTYDALALIWSLSLKNSLVATSDEERKEIGLKIRFSQHILNFFQEKCLFICDESHQNLDSLTRAIFGVGELVGIPENECKHMLAMMKPILANFPKSPTEEEVDALRRSLANEYLKLLPGIPEPERHEILAFWTSKKAKQPAFLKTSSEKKETKELANLISITGHFLLDLLPDILTLRTNVDHARSLYPQRKYEVPARNELPSTAEYDDKYRTCALTIKGNYDRGLSEDDIRFLLIEMLKRSEIEKTLGFNPENTPSNLRFKEWMEKAKVNGPNPRKLEDIQFNNDFLMIALHQGLSKERDVIDYFLTKHAFVGIGAPTEELTCSTTEAFNGAYASVSFSATPREDLAYPCSIKDYYRDLEFEKMVKSKWKEPQNSSIVGAESEEDFFEQMKKGKYLEETVLIDPRGFFRSPSNKVAQKWLDHNAKLDGVLYFKQARSTDVNRDEKICLLQRNGEVLELCGSNIETALKEHNLDWEKLNLGTLYGPAQTESANILQKKGAKVCFFLGDGLTSSHAIQAIMRCRGFMNLNQTVTTFGSKALTRKIFKEKIPTIEGLFSWTDANQKIQEEKRIILNAFQEIHFAIAKEARARIKKAHATDTSPTMDAVVEVYKRHAKGFIECNPIEAFDAFGEHEVMAKTRHTLELYAKRIYKKFAYETDYSSVESEIEKIIIDVEKRISEIASNFEKQTSKEIEQHLELKAQAQREQQKAVPRPADPLSLEGIYGDVKIYSPKYLNISRISARETFNTTFLSEGLYFCKNYLRTAKLRDASDPSPQFLKPIQYYTIIITSDGKVFADAESNDINASTQDHLLSCPDTVQDLKHTAFFVTATGKRVQKGTGALTPPQGKIESVMNSSWFCNLAIDAALLKGKIENPDALIARIQATGWKEFETLWNKIVKGLPNPERAHTKGFEMLKDKYQRLHPEKQ